MKITINESGLEFGEYDEEKLFYIEHSYIYKQLRNYSRSVEFIIADNKERTLQMMKCPLFFLIRRYAYFTAACLAYCSAAFSF